MDNKYFTPEVEELRVGYECQQHILGEYSISISGVDIEEYLLNYYYSDEWTHKESILTSEDIIFILSFPELNMRLAAHIRTPYLTHEQLEADGWKHATGILYKKGDYLLGFRPDQNYRVKIAKGRGKEQHTKYDAECKSINELRVLQKFLGIN